MAKKIHILKTLSPLGTNFGKTFSKKSLNWFNKMIKWFDEPHEKFLFNIALIFIFTIIYKILDIIDSDSFSKRLSVYDSFYFSSISTFTIGYGDITPKSKIAKLAVILNTMIFWIIAIAA